MSFSYSPSLIADYELDPPISALRWLIADTESDSAELSNEELTALFDATSANSSNIIRTYNAAIAAATFLYRKYSKQASFSSGGTSVQLGERAKQWADTISSLTNSLTEVGGFSTVIYAARPSIRW